MKVKVCGIRTLEQMRQLQELGVDYAGMIFYEKSKRYVGALPEEVKREFGKLPVKKVGVFVNAPFATIRKAIADFDLHAVQLHGDETDEFCLGLMDKVKVIKAFRIASQENLDELILPFQNVCHYFLFDTDTAQYGGSGRQFDWDVLVQHRVNKPFFLSGGIGPEDAGRLKSFHHPFLFAVDVNSKFETAPGVKDMNRIKDFINTINHG